uniref:Uncharacterized protein n=1 Tax=Panagrolaimus superbus TaxID=310955 RepID=A0A914Y3F6_9BILA
MIGVQGGSAIRFCQHCLTADYCINGEIRTVSGIFCDARAIAHETSNIQLTIARIRNIKKAHNSVNHEPFFTTIDHSHIVPPALHLLMALVNKLIQYFKNTRLEEIIRELKVDPVQGRSEYDGNSCRKIVKYFCDNKPESVDEIPMFHFFKTAAKIQEFSTAKNLTNSEIDQCGDEIKQLFDDLDGLRNFKFNNKLHILRFHVMPFIIAHGSWGLFSEQGIERLHCLVNEYRKRVSSKNGHKKNIYAIKMLILGTFFHDFKCC